MIPPRTLATWTALSSLLLTALHPSQAQNPSVTVQVNAVLNRHPINPNIYGIAYGTQTVLTDLNVPLNRLGGNNTSRYNWKINADNRANDWFFESVPDPSATAGERGDSFISRTKAGSAQAMMTIPMLDWVAKLGTNRAKLASFSVRKYGAQQNADWSWYPDAGNGILKSTGKGVVNNPADANVPAGPAFQQDWVRQIVSKWGLASSGGLRYYILDNEPGIWHATHRDVHPIGCKLDELRDRTIAFASAIKAVDPGALVVGPEEWGWTNYLYSGYDSQYGSAHGWGFLPDRAAHGNMDAMPWLLSQLRQYEVANGKRLLDVFTLHYYPQGGEFWGGTDTATQLLRNRSTRSLWDPTYVDQTWINGVVQLIPRMKSWVNAYYPGLQTGITEYNWGAEGHINGATTQADIWGIFGREGLDMAARWTYPGTTTPTYKAMKLYRNYDGAKSGFGDTSVYASAPNPDSLSSFAAVRSTDGALTVMVINKVLTGSTLVTVNLANFTGNGTAQAWQLTSANAIGRLVDRPVNSGSLTATLPAQSITLFVLPAAGTPIPKPTAPSNLTAKGWNGRVPLQWDASSGAFGYTVHRALMSGGPYNVIADNVTTTSYVDSAVTNGTRYYYVVSASSPVGLSGDSNEATAVPAPSAASVVFVKTDGSTQGSWKGVYGHDGYTISQLGASLPAYASATVAGGSGYVWLPSTADVRGLQKPTATDRIAACWYGGGYTVNLGLTDSQVHQVAMYFVDWDGKNGRAGSIDISDSATGEPLNHESISSYSAGKWLIWSIKGNVTIRLSCTAGANFTLSGLFFDGQPATARPGDPANLTAMGGTGTVALNWIATPLAESYNVHRSTTAGGPYSTVASRITDTSYLDDSAVAGTRYYYVVSGVDGVGEGPDSNEATGVAAAGSANGAALIKIDSTTHGSWRSTYGQEGYSIAQSVASIPTYARLSLSGATGWTWAISTTDVRAMQKPAAADRIAACWYGQSPEQDIVITDGKSHIVALYALDWDSSNLRAASVQVLDGNTGAILSSQSLSSFSTGKWLVYNVRGHIRIRINRTAGSNAVVSGFFFGPA